VFDRRHGTQSADKVQRLDFSSLLSARVLHYYQHPKLDAGNDLSIMRYTGCNNSRRADPATLAIFLRTSVIQLLQEELKNRYLRRVLFTCFALCTYGTYNFFCHCTENFFYCVRLVSFVGITFTLNFLLLRYRY
jgi:hypothetical protein